MGLFSRKKETPPKQTRNIRIATGEDFREIINSGYTTLDRNPEIIAGCLRIAQLIASMTIYLMANTKNGDVRVVNELSRKIDINPSKNMTRQTWMTSIVMNLLLYGNGNSVVFPHTSGGKLDDLEPIEARRLDFFEVPNTKDYTVAIDGIKYDPQELLHFVFNPDKDRLWHGTGYRVALNDVAKNLAQASATSEGFMASKWKPSLIVKVDALVDEFSSPEGRSRLLEEYAGSAKAGEPWLIPAEQFDVQQIKPLSLQDLAIPDLIQLDKRTVASILGIPPFVLGVGEYNAAAWDGFINDTIRPLAQEIEQEMTRKIILSPAMYLQFNYSKLWSYDIQKTATVYGQLYDKGIVTGNEVRDKIGMQPKDGLDDLLVLENYIPIEESGNQKKLQGGTNK